MAKFPTVRTPTIEEVLDIAEGYGMTITVEDAESYRGLMEGTIASYHRLDDLDEPKLPVKYPRSTGYRPPPEENPYNAWYWKSEVKGRGGGPLKGKRVVLKDNICLAGVPMMNGATVLEGYVPDIDATVVTRILDCWRYHHRQGRQHLPLLRWRQRHHRYRHGREPAQEGSTPPAARRPAAACWLPSARPTWRSAAIRAARSACRPAGAASTGTNRRMGWFPTPGSSPSNRPSTTPAPWPAR